jgi:hypothetical protein
MRKKLFAWCAAALVVLLLPVRSSFGWIATGHTVIGLIAWEDLTPKTKAAVIDLLKQHPRYHEDLLDGLPAGATSEETDRYAFGKAATWPDMVRLQTNPMHTLYNHPNWHFIDIPYAVGVPAPTTEPASDVPGPHNIIEALQKCSTEMTQPATAASERGVDICWVEHLVGDIHQPLHAASFFSPEHPEGDKGGNDDEVLRDPPYPDSKANLHFVWDSLPGDFSSQMMDQIEAAGLRAEKHFSRDHFKAQLTVTDFMAWANESHQLAIDDAYLDGKLQTAVTHKGAKPTRGETIPGLPPGYLDKAEHVAMHQVALAGYRLADLLNAKFDPKQ